MNVAIVQGRVRGELDRRAVKDGSVLVSFDIVVEVEDAPSQHVPVTWAGVEGREPAVVHDQLVTVIGHVHRRFYRSGGRTSSRTDVRADRIVRGTGARAAAAVNAVLADLDS